MALPSPGAGRQEHTRSSHAGAGIALLRPPPASPSSPSGESFVTQTNSSSLVREIDSLKSDMWHVRYLSGGGRICPFLQISIPSKEKQALPGSPCSSSTSRASSSDSSVNPGSDSFLLFPTEAVIPSFSHLYPHWPLLLTASIFASKHVEGFCLQSSIPGGLGPSMLAVCSASRC